MINKKQRFTFLSAAVLSLSLSGCGVFDWLIYKPDIPQGNYMEAQQVEQLRVDMTKEQAEYILGRPVLRDSFSDNTWYYVYHFKSGRDASIIHKELIIHFEDDKIARVEGDYELSEDFNTPLGQGELPSISGPSKDEPLVPESRPDAKPLVQEKVVELQEGLKQQNDDAE
ncbi:outer membrane protein assembly factor BamE [Shewanella sp. WXL01]|uniref:Outer membrane protein assembly factor BamE n=1 Tax=Shewanella maritima TaxID=2520507 RepID=A0A411PEN2_9GAMM|nr:MULTISPECIES: outer membrane protein assembly factor BamE [Shewanella]NKF49985.1 outer membrane protein assembly factor BamE [Shewanella sp. WXL01]QBF81954.1 outer membrane protein assembly factor BamE [Shewanella maritima]